MLGPGGPVRPLAPLLLLAGCGPLFSLDPEGSNDTDGDAATDDADPDADTGVATTVYWGLGGTLALAEGAVDHDGSALAVETRGEACTGTAAVTASEAAALSDTLAAWRLTVEVTTEAGCRWLGPTTLLVGFGGPSTQLGPEADRVGWDVSRSLGLVLAETSASPRLVGLAATDAMRSGAEQPPTTAPTDGRFTLRTLHGLPVGAP